MIDLLDRGLLAVHIIFAFASLVIFWIPVFTKLGGNAHRKTGKAYVFSMWVTNLTAVAMCLINFYYGLYVGGAFLGFLALLTANPLWYGIAVLRHKKGLSRTYNLKQRAFNLALTIAGFAMAIWGLFFNPGSGGVLMVFFGILGLNTGITVIKNLRTPPVDSNWFIRHAEGMINSGIACYTAFFAFGGRTLFENILTGYWQILPWMLPTFIGLTAIRLLKRKYAKKVTKQVKPVLQAS